MKPGDRLPEVIFHTRIRDASVDGPNPFRWNETTTSDYFGGRRVVLFSLPGAFTPTCSTNQLPDFEEAAVEMAELGIDEIYCLSVNDAFVMNHWARSQELKNVKVIPDGSAEFTRRIGMLVRKDDVGFGGRSWRYAAVVDDGVIEKAFVEPGNRDNHPDDPYGVSSPQAILEYLRAKTRAAA